MAEIHSATVYIGDQVKHFLTEKSPYWEILREYSIAETIVTRQGELTIYAKDGSTTSYINAPMVVYSSP